MKHGLNAMMPGGGAAHPRPAWCERAAAAASRVFGRLNRAVWPLADQCVVSAANFVTIYLLARHLESSAFGAFMLAYTGLLLLTNLQNALLVRPHNVLGAALEARDYQRFTGALALAQAALCATACAGLAVAGWIASRQGAAPVASLLLALAVAVVPWMGQEFVRRVMYTRGDVRAAAFNDGLSYGLQVCGALWLTLLWPGQATPEAALLVFAGASFAGVLAGLRLLRSHVHFGGEGALARMGRTWREAWHFGKWLLGQNAVAWFGAQGHSWVVALLLGTEQVGLYRAVTHLVNIMNPLLQSTFAYLPSRGSVAYQSAGPSGLRRWVRRVMPLLALAALPFCLVLAGFPDWVLRLAYGERFADSGMSTILALATVGVCLSFAKLPFDVGLLALRATRSIFYVYLIPVGLLLTAGVALIRAFGLLGVPLSAILINMTLLTATWIAYRRKLAGAAHAGKDHVSA